MAKKQRDATPAEDAALLQELLALLHAPKTLATPIAWRRDMTQLRFEVALDIDGVTEEGLTLRGRTNAILVGQDVSLMLVRVTAGRTGQTFDRLEWRPTQPHTNRPHPDPALSLIAIEGSHHHPLEANAASPGGLTAALRDNLPVARPLAEEPAGWSALAALAATLWRIEGLGDAPEPPWQPELAPRKGEKG